MSRRKLSEYRSKKITNSALGLSYVGWSTTEDNIASAVGYDKYVVKVDQAVKGRFKKGLVFLDVDQADIIRTIAKLRLVGYDSILVEPFVEHEDAAERYLSLSMLRDGYWLSYSAKGGVDIEHNAETIKRIQLNENTDLDELSRQTGWLPEQFTALLRLAEINHFSLMEINPYIVSEVGLRILDCAFEVDDSASYAVLDWTESDLRNPRTEKITPEELRVQVLDRNSPASFNLSVLNPNGSIFLLLSGGGASVVIADEIYNIGLGRELANYGEYSGNPSSDEAYVYTRQVLSLISDSSAPHKVLFIGGAAANFTDIAITFNGVIKAIEESADKLRKAHVKVYVRRGGPRQEIGLAKIKDALDSERLLGGVYDPNTSITDALNIALEELKK
ncbi:MAG TPA: ATP citrate lyase citrate-binding domain-containing protein [Candidatus Microsaccharimonas sp.]